MRFFLTVLLLVSSNVSFANDINWGDVTISDQNSSDVENNASNYQDLPGVRKEITGNSQADGVCGQQPDISYIISGVVSDESFNCKKQQFNAKKEKRLQSGPFQNFAD